MELTIEVIRSKIGELQLQLWAAEAEIERLNREASKKVTK
jgi:hypothetical protein